MMGIIISLGETPVARALRKAGFQVKAKEEKKNESESGDKTKTKSTEHMGSHAKNRQKCKNDGQESV
jgi:hypothetical protein